MVAKAKSGLNKKGIRLLADDLVAHQKRYNQDTRIAERTAVCGTVCCQAGFCAARKIGTRKFNQWVKNGADEGELDVFAIAGEQLGVSGGAEIFNFLWHWPQDLRNEYNYNGPRWRVIADLKALQRLLPDGSIDPDPKAIHTRLPQLKSLLAVAKKVKTA